MVLAKALNSVISSGVEGFEISKKEKYPGYTIAKSWIDFVVFVILLFAVAFFGKLLWNDVLSKYITVIKPLPNVFYTLAMFVALDLFFGN